MSPYRDARWQRVRLHVMERDGWACAVCGVQADLQVHHKRYAPSTFQRPWEAPQEDLVTLCRVHHSERTKADRALRSATADMGADEVQSLLAEIQRRRNAIDVSGDFDPEASRRLERLDAIRQELMEMER